MAQPVTSFPAGNAARTYCYMPKAAAKVVARLTPQFPCPPAYGPEQSTLSTLTAVEQPVTITLIDPACAMHINSEPDFHMNNQVHSAPQAQKQREQRRKKEYIP